MVETLKPVLPFIFDLETTGVDVETADIVQIAAVTADFSKVKESPVIKPRTVFLSYVNPFKPIPPETTEVHGVTDEDVKWAPGQVTALKTMALLMRSYAKVYRVILAGQNIERYDIPIIKRILPGEFDQYDTLDTYTSAIRMFPDKEHRLGPVYEHYVGGTASDAHDAAADCHMCAHIIAKMVNEFDGGLWDFIESLVDPVAMDIFPFGKYKGLPACEVPSGYLHWCKTNFTEPHKDFEATILKCLGED